MQDLYEPGRFCILPQPEEKKISQSGQATIEFALSIILVTGLILLFIQMSLVFAWGNYIHYATFMSARAYLSSSFSSSDQEERARQVAVRMLKKGEGRSGLDRFPIIAKGLGGTPPGIQIGPSAQFSPTDVDLSWMQGVRYTFRSRIFLIPIDQNQEGTSTEANSLILTSESWLGREPSTEECVENLSTMSGVIDNGC